MAASLSQPNEFLFHLETPDLIAVNWRESYLKGWFVPPESVKTWRLVVLVDGEERSVYSGFLRPDVSRHLNIVRAEKSGFVARLPTPVLGQTVSLAVWVDGILTELISSIGRESLGLFTKPMTEDEKVSSYREWIFRCEPKLFSFDAETTQASHKLRYQPTISLLVEFQECHLYFLNEFFRALWAQSYPHWQLCIAADLNTYSDSLQLLQNFATQDPRVTIVPVPLQASSAEVWNMALRAAKGEFVTPARLYDELHPSALSEMVARLQSRDLDLVYSDEDRIDLLGQRSQPQFKPNFDSEHLLSVNFVSRLVVVRSTLARNSGFHDFPPNAQEWDFLLRCVEQMDCGKVAHIAKPLYHLRTVEGLASAGIKSIPVQSDDLCRVVREQAERRGKPVVVEVGFPTDTIRSKYPIPKSLCTAVFLRDEDGVFQVAALLEQINQRRVSFYGTLNRLVHRLPRPGEQFNRSLKSPIVTLPEILGDVFVFINRPIDLLNHYFLQELMSQATRADCGLVTGLSTDSSGRFIHTGFVENDDHAYVDPFARVDSRLKKLGRHVRIVRSVRTISTDFFAVHREHIEKIGGFSHIASMQQLVESLAEHARRHFLQILVTPYAVGAFDWLDLSPIPTNSLKDWNSNLCDFSNPYDFLGS